MKLLVVAPSFPFSGHTFVPREVASALHEGNDVWVLAPSTGDAVGEEFCRSVGFPKDRVIYLNYSRCPVFSADLDRLRPSVGRAARREVYGRVLGQRRRTYFARLLKDPRLRGLDVIHAHFLGWGYRVAVPLGQLLGVPVTVSVHEGELPELPAENLRYVQQSAQVITVVSSAYLRHWVNMTGSDQRLRLVHNAVEVEEFGTPPTRAPLRGRPLRLVSVARLVPHKRIADGIKATRALADRGADVEYAVVGDGPERGELEALVKELGLEQRVRLHGALVSERIRSLLAQADILIHPSEVESFGIAVVEGMAAGLPVVVARTGGALDIVEHGRCGYLYAPGDVDALVDYVSTLRSDDRKREEFGRAGRAIVEQRFSWGQHMSQIYRAWHDAQSAMPRQQKQS